MGDLLLRDVEEQLIRTLKTKAEINGTSLQQEAKKALRRGAPPTGQERLKLLEAHRAKWGDPPRVSADPVDLVREDRDR